MSGFLYALSFYTEYTDGGKAIVAILCLLAIAYGILSCFYGYKIFKFIMGVSGFITGTVLGFFLAIGISGADITGTALTIVSLLFGVLGAIVAVKLYFIGVFIVGALFGGLLGFILTSSMDGGQGPIIILLAIVAGILSVFIKKLMIILSTSVSGAQTISTALYILIFAVSGSEFNWIKDLLWVVFAVLGFRYQYITNKDVSLDPAAGASSAFSGLSSMGRAFRESKFYRYRKPLIITCIIVIALLLFGPRMPFGLLLLITAAAIGLYLFIDKRLDNAPQSSVVTARAAGADTVTTVAANAGGTMGGSSAENTGNITGTSTAGTPEGEIPEDGTPEGNTPEGGVECPSCHNVNNAGSNFCGKCGTMLGGNIGGAL